jgi:hypothetical protein
LAVPFSILGLILSGPLALLGFSAVSIYSMVIAGTLMLLSCGSLSCCFGSTSAVLVSKVLIEVKYSLKASAFSLLLSVCFPFIISGGFSAIVFDVRL